MSLVAFDTNISIWCLKDKWTVGQESDKMKAMNLLKILTKYNVDILIPAAVMSELLSDINDEHKRIEFYIDAEKRFYIGDFNAKASIILGEILAFHYVKNGKQYANDGITKRCMKYDAYIIATSMAHGAECIFAKDKDFKTIAANFIDIKGFDERPDSLLRQIQIDEEKENSKN